MSACGLFAVYWFQFVPQTCQKNKKETEEKKDPFSVCPFSSLFQFGLGTYSRRGSRVAKKTHMSQFFSGKGLHVVVWEGLREVSVGFRGNLPVTAMEMVPTPLVVMLLTTVAGMSSAAPPAPTPPVDTAARNTIKNADASDHRVNQPNVSRLVSLKTDSKTNFSFVMVLSRDFTVLPCCIAVPFVTYHETFSDVRQGFFTLVKY